MKKIRTAVIGFGISAKVFHLPFINTMKEFELAAILERSKDESKENYPHIKHYRTIEEVVNDPDIDLIVITTPNDSHYPYSKNGLEHGKHVVVEKPFTITTEQAMDLVNLSKKSDRVLTVYHNRRYTSDYRTVKKILDEKVLGDIHEFEAHYDRYRAEERPNAWREKPIPGSGILYDLGAHIIDQAFTFFGLPKTVYADIRQQRPHAQAVDYFDLTLDYGFNKVILKAGMLVREPGPRYMIHGTRGSFIKFGDDPQEALLRAGNLPAGEAWGAEPEEMYGLLHTEIDGKIVKRKVPSEKGSYADFYKNVAAAINSQQPVTEKPEQAFNVVRMVELAIKSAEEKRPIECSGFIEGVYPI